MLSTFFLKKKLTNFNLFSYIHPLNWSLNNHNQDFTLGNYKKDKIVFYLVMTKDHPTGNINQKGCT